MRPPPPGKQHEKRGSCPFGPHSKRATLKKNHSDIPGCPRPVPAARRGSHSPGRSWPKGDKSTSDPLPIERMAPTKINTSGRYAPKIAMGQKQVPKMEPGKWNQGVKAAFPWWFNFALYPNGNRTQKGALTTNYIAKQTKKQAQKVTKAPKGNSGSKIRAIENQALRLSASRNASSAGSGRSKCS